MEGPNCVWVQKSGGKKTRYSISDEDCEKILDYAAANLNAEKKLRVSYSNGGRTGIMLDLDLKFPDDSIIITESYDYPYKGQPISSVKDAILDFANEFVWSVLEYLGQYRIENINSTIVKLLFIRDFATKEDEDKPWKYGVHIYLNNLFVTYSVKNTLTPNLFKDKLQDLFDEMGNLNPIDQVIDFAPLRDSASYPFTFNLGENKDYTTTESITFINVKENEFYESPNLAFEKLGKLYKEFLSRHLMQSVERLSPGESFGTAASALTKDFLRIVSPFALSGAFEIRNSEELDYEYKTQNSLTSKTMPIEQISYDEISIFLFTYELNLYNAIEYDISDHMERMKFYRNCCLRFINSDLSRTDGKFVITEDLLNDLINKATRFAYIFRNKPGIIHSCSENSYTEEHIKSNISVIVNTDSFGIQSILNLIRTMRLKDREHAIGYKFESMKENFYHDNECCYFKNHKIARYMYNEMFNENKHHIYCVKDGYIRLFNDTLKHLFKDRALAFDDHDIIYVFNESEEDRFKWDAYDMKRFNERFILKESSNIAENAGWLFKTAADFLPWKRVYKPKIDDIVIDTPSGVFNKICGYVYRQSTLATSQIQTFKSYLVEETKSFSIDQLNSYKDVRGVYNGLIRFDNQTCDFDFLQGDSCKKYFISKSMFASFDYDMYKKYKDRPYQDFIDENENARFMYKFLYDIVVPTEGITIEEATELFEFRIFQIMDNIFNFNAQNLRVIVAFGTGSDGKTTLSQAIQNMLGGSIISLNDGTTKRLYTHPKEKGYSGSLKASNLLFDEASPESHSSGSVIEAKDLLYVVMAEPEKNKTIKSSTIKKLVGSTPIIGRKCHSPNMISMVNTAIIELQTNNELIIDSDDAGTRRRIYKFTYPNKFRTKEECERIKKGVRVADAELEFTLTDPKYIDVNLILYCLVYRKVKLELMEKKLKYMMLPKLYRISTDSYFNKSDPVYEFKASRIFYDKRWEIYIQLSKLREAFNEMMGGDKNMRVNDISLLESFDRSYPECVCKFNRITKTMETINTNMISGTCVYDKACVFVKGIVIKSHGKFNIINFVRNANNILENNCGVSIQSILENPNEESDIPNLPPNSELHPELRSLNEKKQTKKSNTDIVNIDDIADLEIFE